jgi:ubiquitin-protein ligase
MLGTTVFSEGGIFRAVMEFPVTYPMEPPKLRFKTPIWHPNGNVKIGWDEVMRVTNSLFSLSTTSLSKW